MAMTCRPEPRNGAAIPHGPCGTRTPLISGPLPQDSTQLPRDKKKGGVAAVACGEADAYLLEMPLQRSERPVGFWVRHYQLVAPVIAIAAAALALGPESWMEY